MPTNDNLAQTRLSPGAKHALKSEARERGISVSMRMRQILTRDLRKRWTFDDDDMVAE